LQLFVVTVSSLYLGGFLAHKGASYLEENEIFVPAEDDDDDD
uniref:Essential MCU regulator, mitochondrial n=1 Tax=Haemonchus placei TaxID=6290 RepID=A0A0N4W2A8_HAEPC